MSVSSRKANAPAGMRTYDDRARAAVKKFRQMLPTLNAYVRSVSGNPKLRIIITAHNGASTKDEIYFQPPLALGDDLTHEESYCDQRDSEGIQACEACRVHEHILSVMYHEIGHIAFGTHATPSVKHELVAKKQLAPDWIKIPDTVNPLIRDEHAGIELMNRYHAIPEERRSYMSLAGSLHSRMGILYNGTEDARVNEAIFAARRGVRSMFNALMAEIVRDGVPNPDDQNDRAYWKDMGLEFQMILAVSNQLQGFNERWPDLYADQIYSDLENEKLQDHLASWVPEISAMESLEFTTELMKILNEMGYLLDDEQKEEQKDDGDSGDPSGKGGSSSGGDPQDSKDSEDGAGDEESTDTSDSEHDGSSDGDGEEPSEGASGHSDGETPDERPGSDADSKRPGGDLKKVKICIGDQLEPDMHAPNEDSTDRAQRELAGIIKEAIEKAIQQAEVFDTTSREVRGIRFIQPGSPGEWNKREQDPAHSDSALNNSVLQARVTFEENRRKRKLSNLKRGKVSQSALGKRAVLDDDRLFHQTVIPGKRDYDVTIGMDLSGSTSGPNLRLEKDAIYAQAELLSRIGVPFSIYGHSGDDELLVLNIKRRDDAWDRAAKHRLMTTQALGANLDGHALEFLRKRSDESRATERIVMYYSDGYMPMENYHEELEILQREIMLCKRRRTTLIGVGIRTDSPIRHGLDTVEVNSADDLPAVLNHLKKYLLRRAA